MSNAPAPPLSDDEEGLAQRLAALLVAAWRRHACDEAAEQGDDATPAPDAGTAKGRRAAWPFGS